MNRRFLVPTAGLVMGMLGTFSPLAVGPAGPALSFAGVTGVITLLRGGGEAGDRTRMRVFVSSVLVSAVLCACHMIFNNPPRVPDRTWGSAMMGISLIAATLVILIVIRFITLMRGDRSPRPATRARGMARIAILAIPVVTWLALALINVMYAAMVVMSTGLAALSEPVRAISGELRQGEAAFYARARVQNGRMSIGGGGMLNSYAWACKAPAAIEVNGEPRPVNDMDRAMLEAICEHAPV